jgi:glycosyltransferase involved in cell wall biosynthesis
MVTATFTQKVTLSIFVPCFNEEKGISCALKNIKEGIHNVNYEVLVADDASTDKTVEIVEKFKEKNPEMNIKIFSNKTNKGLGFNFWQTAKRAQGKYYMLIFGDHGIPSDSVRKLTSNIGKADMILAYYKDSRVPFRRIVSKTFVSLINLIHSNNIKYYNCDNIYLLEDVKFFKNGPSGFAYQAELITSLIRKNKTYIELEINLFWESHQSTTGTSRAFKFSNLVSVGISLLSMLSKQIVYILKR